MLHWFQAGRSRFAPALVFVLLGLTPFSVLAKVSVSTPASANISADTASGVYTSLTGPVLDESAGQDIGTGTIVLSPPAGFTFDPTAIVIVSVTRLSGSGTPLTLASNIATVTSTSITINVTANDGTSRTRSRISWSGIRVQLSSGTPLASGEISNSGTAPLKGLNASSSFGHLSETPGLAAQLAFATQPSGATAGAALGTQPVVVTRDQFGNNSSNGLGTTNMVTLSLASGTGPLQGNTSLNIGASGGNGTVSFSGLRIDAAGSKQLLASGTSVSSATSSTFTVAPGPASTLVISTQPSTSANAGVPFAQQPAIQIQDAFGNLRNTDALVVTASAQAGGGSLGGGTAVTSSGGLASFTNLSALMAGNVSLIFTSGSLNPATSLPINVAAGAFSKLQLLLPGETAAPGTSTGKTGTPSVQTVGVGFPISLNAVDANWNRVNSTDLVHVSSSDPSAALPANTPLISGHLNLTVTNNSSGTQTLAVSDVTSPSIGGNTSAPYSVNQSGTSTGPVLPAQGNRTINELTTLVVTNTATDAFASTNNTSQNATNTFIFNYSSRTALLADGWNFLATNPNGTSRNTEITSTSQGGVISYDQAAHPGTLRIPCDVGDLWGNLNTSRNALFRPLPTNWTSMQLALAFAPTINYQQVHLALYQNDDNFTQSGLAHNDDLGGEVSTLIWEVNAAPNHFYTVLNNVTSIHLRLDRNLTSGDITGYYSLNGSSWVLLGSANTPLVNPRLSIWVGGSPVAWNSSLPSCDLQRLDVISTNSNSTGPALSYTLVNPPAGAAIDSNGIITWTPTEAQGPSTNLITTVVTDNQQPPQSATNSFTVVVNEVNAPPTLPAQPNQTIVGQTALMVTNTATDSDVPANTLTYQLQGAPANATISANGVVSWTPNSSQVPSTNIFTTIVTDSNPWAVNSQHLSATNSFTVTVLSSPPPNGPALPAQSDRTIAASSTLIVTNTGTDPRLAPGALSTNSSTFAYSNRTALLADGWSYIATAPGGASRNTEITNTANGAIASYDQTAHPGTLRIPCDLGDLWASANNSRNSIFRALPSNWLSLRLAIAFAPAQNYQQAHLLLYQDDDNYVESGVAYNGGQKAAMDQEVAGSASTPGVAAVSVTSIYLRLDRTSGSPNVTAFYSLNGSTWNTLAQVSQNLTNPRLGIWVGGSQVAWTTGAPSCDLQRLDMVVTNQAAPVTLTYRLVNPPAGATIDANGIITWTPTAAQAPSTNLFTTIVTDNGVPPMSATNNFTVIVSSSGPTALLVQNQTKPMISYDAARHQVSLSLQAEPGRSYNVEWTSNLNASWSPLATVTADSNGQIVCTLPEPAPTAYFRLVLK